MLYQMICNITSEFWTTKKHEINTFFKHKIFGRIISMIFFILYDTRQTGALKEIQK